MEEGVYLDLELIWIAEEEEDKNSRLKAEEEACLVEEARLKYEEEDLRLKSEDEACLIEEARMKSDQEEQACLNSEKEARLV